jgi:hypothetical protein
MALRFLLDENLRGLLWRAIQTHNTRSPYPLDCVRVGDPPDLLLGSDDADILIWAEREGRILLSLDKRTLSGHLSAHLQAGHHSPGIFILAIGAGVSVLISELTLRAYASDPWEWEDRIEYIP